MENKENMDIEKEFQHYLDIFKKDKELPKTAAAPPGTNLASWR